MLVVIPSLILPSSYSRLRSLPVECTFSGAIGKWRDVLVRCPSNGNGMEAIAINKEHVTKS